MAKEAVRQLLEKFVQMDERTNIIKERDWKWVSIAKIDKTLEAVRSYDRSPSECLQQTK